MSKLFSAVGGLISVFFVGGIGILLGAGKTLSSLMLAGAVGTIAKILSIIVVLVMLALLMFRGIRCLDKDEQLRIQYFTGATVRDGPGLVFLNPFSYRSAVVVKVSMIGTLDYAVVVDTVSGAERVECGPKLLFLGPHERVEKNGHGTSLSTGEYLIVEDKLTGEKSVVKGPCVWFPRPHDVSQKGTSLALSKTEYVIVEDRLSGEKHVIKGPCVWFPGPHEAGQKGSSINLNMTEYLIVEDKLTGMTSTVKGPSVWFPGPYDSPSAKQAAISLQEDEYVKLKDVSTGQRWVQQGKGLVFLEPMWQVEGNKQKAWILKANEYIRLLNVNSGKVTVHRGASNVFPGPDDKILGDGVQKAVVVDSEHAVLVRDRCTGQLRLETEKQVFFPGPNDDVEEVRELIKLADHEAMILKDGNGNYQYYYGSDEKRSPDQPKAFFLPAYAEIVKVWWSRGPRRERKDVYFERFDCRPHFMKFEFNCRTADNVELILEGVMFWELVDLPAMWRHTGDTSGDLVYHLRSKFILQVAQVPLKKFMETLHMISKSILDADSEFYAARGLKVYSLEITRYQCADKSTAEILEQIIQETTNRMNRLSQAESENEVAVFRTQGQGVGSTLFATLSLACQF
jgi:hypothetical protein